MRKTAWWLRIRNSYWFLPTVYSILSILAVGITTVADLFFIEDFAKVIPSIFLTNRSVAMSLYTALITSILTMTTISFSSIMVVLTTYSQQFSPRTLQDFMSDRTTQHVLGVYVFGFIYTLCNLLLLTKDKERLLASPFLTVVVAITTLGFFVVFIHHSTRWVQVNNLIGKIQHETYDVIGKTFSEKQYDVFQDWDQQELDQVQSGLDHVVHVQRSGYLQHIEFKAFIQWAKQHKATVWMHAQVGDYVEKGTPIFSYTAEQEEADINETAGLNNMIVGKERTSLQDIEFSIQKLVEIALRAISPGINDPHTAINCINRIGSLLSELGHKYKPFKYYTDEDEKLRIILMPKPYREYLYKSFYQIRLYGKHDVSVMNGVLEALYKTALVNDGEIREDIWKFSVYIIDGIKDEGYHEIDLNVIRDIASELAELCQKEPVI
ncbi:MULTISPECIES: DUF2254 domain-containing protein [Pontibacillus]|uniref:DUF2254 domain-containing protein n=1 Tax=Pontibacillus chungwhensis TaxID=265426 RepID=A0ABY8UY87_9BACI|nr:MULTISPECIES: DUF2254 domain-containing protein [Pontibacillus]MCD5325797.1 DUF2254 domain-containing protein [Pontibacillus sp. HN14]WIF98330.1 DUF2254 domain-containing protein [Pontibacillus chungwhensis]